jgi:Glycosyl hydrolase family 3 N terminal domain
VAGAQKLCAGGVTKSHGILYLSFLRTWQLSVLFWNARKHVAACAKHYVGDGGTHNGINENNTMIDFRGLLRTHMAPYYNAIIKGVSTVMVSYSSWNGEKMHANHFLVTDFLKNMLKFRVSFCLDFLKIWLLSMKFIKVSWCCMIRVLLFLTGKELTRSPPPWVQTTLIQFWLLSMQELTWYITYLSSLLSFFFAFFVD